MAVQSITYQDKQALNTNEDISDVNKCNASDMNEIKSVVNNNANILQGQTTYSLNETDTRKIWINGKPIYRKVINCGSLLNNDTKIVSHSISDLEFVIKLRLMCITGTVWYEANMAGTSGIFNGGIVAIRANATDLQIGTTFDATQHVGYAIIEYTKAS